MKTKKILKSLSEADETNQLPAPAPESGIGTPGSEEPVTTDTENVENEEGEEDTQSNFDKEFDTIMAELGMSTDEDSEGEEGAEEGEDTEEVPPTQTENPSIATVV